MVILDAFIFYYLFFLYQIASSILFVGNPKLGEKPIAYCCILSHIFSENEKDCIFVLLAKFTNWSFKNNYCTPTLYLKRPFVRTECANRTQNSRLGLIIAHQSYCIIVNISTMWRFFSKPKPPTKCKSSWWRYTSLR